MECAHEVDAKTEMLEKSLSYYVDLEKKGKGTKRLWNRLPIYHEKLRFVKA